MNKQNNLIEIGFEQSADIIADIYALYATKKDHEDFRPRAALSKIFAVTAQILYLDSIDLDSNDLDSNDSDREKMHVLLDTLLDVVEKKT